MRKSSIGTNPRTAAAIPAVSVVAWLAAFCTITTGCPGSVIGGKYGLGNNEAGYAEEARVRQERRDKLAADRANYDRICVAPQTEYQVNWCAIHGHELDRAEDRLERQEDREDAAERDFQDRRERRRREIQQASQRPPDNSLECVSRPDGYGGSRTSCH